MHHLIDRTKRIMRHNLIGPRSELARCCYLCWLWQVHSFHWPFRIVFTSSRLSLFEGNIQQPCEIHPDKSSNLLWHPRTFQFYQDIKPC